MMRGLLFLQRAAACGSAALLIAGCAANKPIVQQDRYNVDLSAYTAVRVVVDAVKEITPGEALDATSAELRQHFVEQLRAAGKFLVVEEPPAAGQQLEARLTIASLNYVSGATRGVSMVVPIVGLAAGRSALAVDLKLTDTQSGDVVLRMNARQVERGAQNPLTATTGSQIADIAKELADKVSAATKR